MDAVKELADAGGDGGAGAGPARAGAGRAGGRALRGDGGGGQPGSSSSSDGVEGGAARDYLEEPRHLATRRRRKFGFGFAPDSRGKLKAALKQFGNDKLVEAGLLIAPEDEQASPTTASAAG